MKRTVTTLALAAILAGTSHAAISGNKPAFMDKRQLATMRAEAASNSTRETEDSAFFTGKPFLDTSDEYAFKYRSYTPVIARWTSEDPSGYPDGSNNQIYVNNSVMNSIDVNGLNIWQITNSNAVQGAGHTAMISGSGNSFQLQSYGMGNPGMTSQNFTSSQAALDAAAGQGYIRYNEWNTSTAQDTAAQNAFTSFSNDPYHVTTHNCGHALLAGLDAAGVEHDATSHIPNQIHTLNKIYSDDSETLTKPE